VIVKLSNNLTTRSDTNGELQLYWC